MHYLWTSREAFNVWHDAVCAALGIPHPNSNSATGEVDLEAQWTLSYTNLVEVSSGDFRAFVEDSVALLIPDGLGVPCDPPPSPDFEL